jgi:hypothetical protein
MLEQAVKTIPLKPVYEGIVTSYRPSPFAVPGDFITHHARAGQSIAEIIEDIAPDWQHPYLRVVLNDEVIAKDDWALTVPCKDDTLNIILVPQGGDAGQIFKMIAVIVVVAVVSYFTAGALGPTAAGGMGLLSSAGAAAAGAAVGAVAGLAASLALNALFPPPAPSTASTGSSGVAEDPVYGFNRTSNTANPYGCIPRVYGRRKVLPLHAMNPYIISSGSNQFLYQIFTAGYGPLAIEQIMIGDTPIGNYKDVEYFIHEAFLAGDELKICKEDVWTDPYSINLLKNSASVRNTTEDAERVAIDIQFPMGLYQVNKSNGNQQAWSVDFSVEIAPVGSSTWSPISAFAPTVDGNGVSIYSAVTSNSWEAVGSPYAENPAYPVVDALPESSSRTDGEMLTTVSYDENGYATYQNHVNHYTLSGSSNTVRVSGQFTRAFFATIYATLPTAGQYQIRVTRLSDDQDPATTAVYCNSYLSSIRTYKNAPPVAPDKPISLIEVKIKATDQLNGSINNLSCIVTSKLPVYDGNNWVIQPTRNPAWAYLDVLRGNAIKKPIADQRIDLDAFKEWADWCNGAMLNAPGMPRAMCDLEISSQSTIWETLRLIAATGYGAPTLAGGKHSIAIDRIKDTPVQLFTPRNTLSFSASINYLTRPHALRVSYTPEDSATADEVIVYDDGYNATGTGGKQQATNFEPLKLVGISRYEQAYTMARRAIAQGKLRIETWTINTDVENLLATRGSFVRLAHDVPKLGTGWGRITGITGQTITLDEDFKVTTGSLIARVRTKTGEQIDFPISAAQGNRATLTGNISVISEGDVLVYGESNRITMDCLVKSIRPGPDLTAQLELIPYAPAIYTAEVSEIPEYDPNGNQWTGGSAGGGTGTSNKTTPGQVTALKASAIVTYDNKAPRISITLSWGKPVTGGTAVSYKIYHRDGGTWKQIGQTVDLSYIAFDNYQFVDADGNPLEMAGRSLVFAVSGVGADGSSYPPETAASVSVTPIVDPSASAATLTAVGGVFEIILSWNYANTGFDAAFAELWGGTTNNRASAGLVAKVAVPQKVYHHVGLVPGSTWYYWIRFVDGKGGFSEWYPISSTGGVSASPSTDPTIILDQLNGAIDTTQLAEELNQRIDLIDDPDTVPGSVRALIKTETTNRTTADSALQSQVATIAATTNTNAAAIQSEATARANGDSANATTINQVQARLDTGDYAAVKVQSSASASAITGLNAKYSVQVDANGGVVGIMLNSNGVGTGSFIVSADFFKVYKPGYTSMPMFQVGTVNGTTAVGIKGNLIVDGTIVTNGLANNSVTIPLSQTSYDAIGGNGGTQTINTIYYYAAYPSSVLIIFNGRQNYDSGSRNTQANILVDGWGVTANGIAGAINDYVAISWSGVLSVGFHTITVDWHGQDGSVRISNRTLSVLGTMR